MNKKTSPLKVTFLDKEYLITCEEEEVDSLHSAIDFLNNKILNKHASLNKTFIFFRF